MVRRWCQYKWRYTNWCSHIILWLHKITSPKPVHILPTSSSHIDLIFTDQHNLTVDRVVHSVLNYKVEYPETYQRLVCGFKRVNPTLIWKSVKIVKLEMVFVIKLSLTSFSFKKSLVNISDYIQIISPSPSPPPSPPKKQNVTLRTTMDTWIKQFF